MNADTSSILLSVFLSMIPSGITCLAVFWMLAILVADWSPDFRKPTYTLSHRFTGQWRLGLFTGTCCMVAGFVYGLMVVR